MQCWDQVKINDEKHPENGRAGVVSAVLVGGKEGSVFLDATAEKPAKEVQVKESQVQFLGR